MRRQLLLASFFLLIAYSYSSAQPTIPKDTLITLERNPGFFGTRFPCPFYKLTISSDGAVELETKKYIRENNQYKVGTSQVIKSRVTQEQVNQLVSEFERIDFWSLKSTFENQGNSQEDCPEFIPDATTAITSITFKGRSKKVEHYRGCRGTESLDKLTNLENKIDEMVNIKQWVDCSKILPQ